MRSTALRLCSSATLIASVVGASGLAGPRVLRAQAMPDTTYVVSDREPGPLELVAVVVSSRWCAPCNRPEYKTAIRKMKVLVARQAAAKSESFAAIGLGLDWNTDTAWRYFASLGQFDELVLGRNWRNTGVITYVWRDSATTPGIPQVIILRRHVTESQTRLAVSPDSVLTRIAGAKQIVDWVARGAPVPGA